MSLISGPYAVHSITVSVSPCTSLLTDLNSPIVFLESSDMQRAVQMGRTGFCPIRKGKSVVRGGFNVLDKVAVRLSVDHLTD